MTTTAEEPSSGGSRGGEGTSSGSGRSFVPPASPVSYSEASSTGTPTLSSPPADTPDDRSSQHYREASSAVALSSTLSALARDIAVDVEEVRRMNIKSTERSTARAAECEQQVLSGAGGKPKEFAFTKTKEVGADGVISRGILEPKPTIGFVAESTGLVESPPELGAVTSNVDEVLLQPGPLEIDRRHGKMRLSMKKLDDNLKKAEANGDREDERTFPSKDKSKRSEPASAGGASVVPGSSSNDANEDSFTSYARTSTAAISSALARLAGSLRENGAPTTAPNTISLDTGDNGVENEVVDVSEPILPDMVPNDDESNGEVCLQPPSPLPALAAHECAVEEREVAVARIDVPRPYPQAVAGMDSMLVHEAPPAEASGAASAACQYSSIKEEAQRRRLGEVQRAAEAAALEAVEAARAAAEARRRLEKKRRESAKAACAPSSSSSLSITATTPVALLTASNTSSEARVSTTDEQHIPASANDPQHLRGFANQDLSSKFCPVAAPSTLATTDKVINSHVERASLPAAPLCGPADELTYELVGQNANASNEEVLSDVASTTAADWMLREITLEFTKPAPKPTFTPPTKSTSISTQPPPPMVVTHPSIPREPQEEEAAFDSEAVIRRMRSLEPPSEAGDTHTVEGESERIVSALGGMAQVVSIEADVPNSAPNQREALPSGAVNKPSAIAAASVAAELFPGATSCQGNDVSCSTGEACVIS